MQRELEEQAKRLKQAAYAEAYGAGEIVVGRILGEYPVRRSPLRDLGASAQHEGKVLMFEVLCLIGAAVYVLGLVVLTIREFFWTKGQRNPWAHGAIDTSWLWKGTK
jgi:hypothetical protein